MTRWFRPLSIKLLEKKKATQFYVSYYLHDIYFKKIDEFISITNNITSNSYNLTGNELDTTFTSIVPQKD